jgi:hypothetical protein
MDGSALRLALGVEARARRWNRWLAMDNSAMARWAAHARRWSGRLTPTSSLFGCREYESYFPLAHDTGVNIGESMLPRIKSVRDLWGLCLISKWRAPTIKYFINNSNWLETSEAYSWFQNVMDNRWFVSGFNIGGWLTAAKNGGLGNGQLGNGWLRNKALDGSAIKR